MKNDVPFVANTPDDLHCMQAAYMMIAKYFQPDFAMDMNEWSKFTGFEKDKGTWASAGLLWFKEHGYQIRHLSLFDYETFVKSPEAYLIELTGKAVGAWQIAHTNIPVEVNRIKKLLQAEIVERRQPTIVDIKKFLDDGYLVRVLVNANKLNGKEGYFGHAIPIIGYDDKNIVFHDPGLPPTPNRSVTCADFEAAWADPNPESKELDAIKL